MDGHGDRDAQKARKHGDGTAAAIAAQNEQRRRRVGRAKLRERGHRRARADGGAGQSHRGSNADAPAAGGSSANDGMQTGGGEGGEQATVKRQEMDAGGRRRAGGDREPAATVEHRVHGTREGGRGALYTILCRKEGRKVGRTERKLTQRGLEKAARQKFFGDVTRVGIGLATGRSPASGGLQNPLCTSLGWGT